MRLFCLAGFVSLLGLAFVSSASAANIVANPGFEAGGTGWIFNGWGIYAGAGTLGVAHTGTMDASTGCVGAGCITPDPASGGAWLYQDLATTPGSTYSLTFWFASAGTPMELRALFGSTIAVDLTGISAGGYIQYANTVTLTASSSTTRLEFLGRQDPAWNSLDDINVEAIGQGETVPEPSGYLLLGSGLALLAGWRRLRA